MPKTSRNSTQLISATHERMAVAARLLGLSGAEALDQACLFWLEHEHDRFTRAAMDVLQKLNSEKPRRTK